MNERPPIRGWFWRRLTRVERYEAALVEIRDQDPVENALDPQWAARIAKEALRA